MNRADSVIEKALKRITPSAAERKNTEAVLSRIKQVTEDVIKPLHLKYTLAGSFLRDTWLADKREFDIFILFPESVTREGLEMKGLQIGKKIVKSLGGTYEIAYAEHPYTRATVEGYALDLVPCYDIKDAGKIKSAVDRTPHHNRYMTKNLKPILSSEVRLLKQFSKSIGVYGSDLRVEGFSGYLSELLIIRYRSFLNLLREAGKWEAGRVFIDLEKHHRTRPDTKSKYPNQPLIVIDPVDRNRNVAAALSPANFEKFRESAKAFLEKPSDKYFSLDRKVNIKGLSKTLKSRKTRMLALSFSRPKVVDDVIYPQMRRSARRIKSMLEDSDFRVIGYDVWCDDRECLIFLEMDVWDLPKIKKLTGPPTFSRQHSDEFTKKYRGKGRIWVEGDRLVTEVKREFTDAGQFLKKVMGAKRKTLLDSGIASYVAESVSKSFSLISGAALIKKAARNDELAFSLSDYFKNKIL
ncbi:MAG: CCA tRNA nucleotidyltransferase [Candidatus Aenigmatarchaeota archaeon]|nr:MAG: CCA tRNA nucleotidyltransferase [Candidatus Aenigmarchaeota archaeon]